MARVKLGAHRNQAQTEMRALFRPCRASLSIRLRQ